MGFDTAGWQFIRVTAGNLATLFGALPKAVLNKVRQALAKDWRSGSSVEAEIEERRAELVNGMPMGYTLIYESKDGRLCLYQDREGHLVAADTSKFV